MLYVLQVNDITCLFETGVSLQCDSTSVEHDPIDAAEFHNER